jgi:hypothetical protein
MRIRRFLLIMGLLSSGMTSGCAPDAPAGGSDSDPLGDNVVRSGEDIDVVIGDAEHDFQVVSSGSIDRLDGVIPAREALARALLPEGATMARTVRASRRRPARDSLVVGYPLALLGESAAFGGVLTRVSDPDDETLGSFKLAAVAPMHVRPLIAPTEDGEYALALVGCAEACTETSPQEVQLSIPIRGINVKKQQVLLDISRLGEGLSIANLIPPEFLGLEEVESRATFVDYSMATLVFDVRSKMRRLEPEAQRRQPPLYLTMRWYLELGSGFNDAFTVRDPIPEFGYFTTVRSLQPRIARFSTTRFEDRAPVKYYVKNVPAEYRGAFDAGFEEWNRLFRELLGHDLLVWEHIDASDPRSELLVAGDVRFNIVEWDLDNKAFYGGLGPSVANDFTGEIFSAQVLVQGPDIVNLYRDWFDVLAEADALRQAGEVVAAERILAEGQRRIRARLATPARRTQIQIGQLDVSVPAEQPPLLDPVMAGFDFDDTPPGVSFETYMQGYFRELTAHELGHNLGLTHNFKGSLRQDEQRVSSSVMEYVSRPERYRATVDEYDRQAIAYGYTGQIAGNPQPFCWDFESPWLLDPTLSAECASNDAGADPFAYYRDSRVRRAIDLVIGRGLGASAPVWTYEDVSGPLEQGLEGMAFYATSAEATSHTWDNFFLDATRPTEPQAIAAYVIAEIQGTLCEPSIADEIRAKHALDAGAGLIARQNWAAVLGQAQALGEQLGLPIGSCGLIDELPF